MTDPLPPLQLMIGPAGHGVVDYARDIAEAVGRRDARARVARAVDAVAALAIVASEPRTHLHVTDRLLGSSPEQAAEHVAQLAARTRLTITLHDVPQTSDGRGLARRIDAYRRFAVAAEAVAVNSVHESLLLDEFTAPGHPVAAIPIGARGGRAGVEPAHGRASGERTRDLVVLIGGYFYPGKGHEAGVRAAAEAARALRREGETVGRAVVRALGRPSPGHEGEAAELAAMARTLDVDFELTGFLDDDAFAAALGGEGVPLAPHEHVSASRTMLDWAEAGRRALVADSRYAAEMDALRPGTIARYAPAALAAQLAAAWRDPASTWLAPGTVLAPSMDDTAVGYLQWWGRAA